MQSIEGASASESRVRAAQYVRMSTDHQQYSPEHQKPALADYARVHDIDIVETYEDDGRSGVTLRHRPALLKLLKDVLDPGRAFETVLVYDVSRWGRFQDVDESAHHEYICRQAGVRVIYCAEPFVNDGTPASNIIKVVKRAMAGEYSRELSEKVFIGQCRHVERGFWQGAPPGFGLRRMLVDITGKQKCFLAHTERKSIQTDRTILVPGPPNETALVRKIFEWYVHDRLGTFRISSRLNDFGLYNAQAHPWTSDTIRLLLRNEKYVGNLVWNRTSVKLHSNLVRNDPSRWLRAPGAFVPVVDADLFNAAQVRINRYRHKPDTSEYQASMSRLLRATGKLSVRTMLTQLDICGKSNVRRHFASLDEGYRSVGYRPPADIAFVDQRMVARRSMTLHVADLVSRLRQAGHEVEQNTDGSFLRINRELRIKVCVSLGRKANTYRSYAEVKKSKMRIADLALVGYYPRPWLCLTAFYLLPTCVLSDVCMTPLSFSRVPGVEGFRIHDLSTVLMLCARKTIGGSQ
ncbi:recombinase family protein [Paraburkholderia sp. C35]|uniref:recombinase family protein n=1 Tax=Paraburkholderia sp. C35 TaxID=2126993 RepID=UPI000D69E2E8|nr:recombinase family protein [Paraburkholderia sp. C35]